MNIKIGISVCRVCLKSDEQCIQLYDDPVLQENFQFSTQIEVKENDGLPGILCARCVARLRISCEFKRQSLNSDRHLRAFIEKVNNQFKEVAVTTTTDPTDVPVDNDDENELLIEAGYKIKPIETIAEIAHMPTKIEQQDQLQNVTEDVDFIVAYDEVGEDDECLEGAEEGEMLQLEDGTISSEFQEVHSEGQSEDEENLQDISTMSGSSQFLLDTKDIDPLERPKNENRSNICIKCDKDFSTKTNLIRHMMTHDGVKPFQCNICGNGFTQNGSLKQHMLIHTGERPYKCEICNRGFTQGKSLTFHMRRHTGEKPFPCNKCGLSFRQKDGLKRHTSMKHSDTVGEVQYHICSICQRVLHSKYSLNLHMKKHVATPEVHRCDMCEKAFSTKASLENHQRQHTGEKFDCDQCDKKFSRKGSLMTHIKMHADVKPFTCDTCQKGFVQKHQLTAHLITHKNQPAKSFQCGKCYKSFAIKRNLLQHLRNHNREYLNLFKCDDCDIAFNTKRGLKLHRSNEHKETITDLNECDICHIPFVSVADLNHHMISIHDTTDEKCQLCDQHFTSKKNLEDHLLEHELLNMS